MREGMYFNPPPNWPPSPSPDWIPPEGWKPDPAWGPTPDGWRLTVWRRATGWHAWWKPTTILTTIALLVSGYFWFSRHPVMGDNERLFVEALRTEAPGLTKGDPLPSEILDTGKTTCYLFEQGLSAFDVVLNIEDHGANLHEAAVLVDLSTTYLCPQWDGSH